MVLSAAFYCAERKTKFGKANYRVRQAVIGSFFGGVAVLATAFGVQSEESVLNVRTTKIRRLGVNMGKFRVKQGNISRFWPIFFDFENIFRKKYEPWNENDDKGIKTMTMQDPFQVKDDERMDQLVESIRMNGVLNPVIALKIDENHYQLISGHRRKRACMRLGIDRIPLIGREMTKEEAVIEMVDSNLQREHILPSEKAKAYKMKMDAMKNQGKRTDLTSSPLGTKLRTDEIIAQEAGESRNQIQRYIRLS